MKVFQLLLACACMLLAAQYVTALTMSCGSVTMPQPSRPTCPTLAQMDVADGNYAGSASGDVVTLTGTADFLGENYYPVFGVNTIWNPACTSIVSSFWNQVSAGTCEDAFSADFNIDDLTTCGISFSETSDHIIGEGDLFWAAIHCSTGRILFQKTFNFTAIWDRLTYAALSIDIDTVGEDVTTSSFFNSSIILYLDSAHTLVAMTDGTPVIGERIWLWGKVAGVSSSISALFKHVFISDHYSPNQLSTAVYVVSNGAFTGPGARHEPESHTLEDGTSWLASDCLYLLCTKFIHTWMEVSLTPGPEPARRRLLQAADPTTEIVYKREQIGYLGTGTEPQPPQNEGSSVLSSIAGGSFLLVAIGVVLLALLIMVVVIYKRKRSGRPTHKRISSQELPLTLDVSADVVSADQV